MNTCILILVKTVFKGYLQMTKVATSEERVEKQLLQCIYMKHPNSQDSSKSL